MTDFLEAPELEKMATDAADSAASAASEAENFVRKHPVLSVVAAVGIGCGVGLIIRSLFASPPPPPKHRAVQTLEEIQHRLNELVGPAYKRASHYAEEGAGAVKKSIDHLGDTQFGSRIRRFFE